MLYNQRRGTSVALLYSWTHLYTAKTVSWLHPKIYRKYLLRNTTVICSLLETIRLSPHYLGGILLKLELFGDMNKVYNYLNSHPNPEGFVEILGTTYRITRVHNLRHSERPEFRGTFQPSFGVWYIQPHRGVYLRVELISVLTDEERVQSLVGKTFIVKDRIDGTAVLEIKE